MKRHRLVFRLGLAAAVAAVVAPLPAQLAEREPFFLFAAYRLGSAADREDVHQVLRDYFGPHDYIGKELAKDDPELARQVGKDHVFALAANLDVLGRYVADREGAIVFYDMEHWPQTPKAEQEDPAGAVARAAGVVHAGGAAKFGLCPDGPFLGIDPKSCSASADKSVLRRIDPRTVDILLLQAQILLSDRCAAQGGPERYVSFVTSLAREARERNPDILVAAQASFRYTPPDRMIKAMRAVQDAVDGFYLAWPVENPRVPNVYCSSDNLRRILQEFRGEVQTN